MIEYLDLRCFDDNDASPRRYFLPDGVLSRFSYAQTMGKLQWTFFLGGGSKCDVEPTKEKRGLNTA